jgi:anti-sigma factor RsiW
VSCEYLERDLDAYLDRELDAETTRAVREHLSGCANCRDRVAERDALSRIIQSAPYYHAPDRLRTGVSARAGRVAASRRLLAFAAAAVLLFAVGAGVAFSWRLAGQNNAIVEEVVDGHVRSLMANHLFDVQSTDQHTVKPWFLGQLDFSPPVTDLAASGFPLVGGRLDYLAGRPVAALVYQRRKHTINVFVSPESDNAVASADVRSVRGFHVYHWTQSGMSFWAVSDLNETELANFVRTLQRS